MNAVTALLVDSEFSQACIKRLSIVLLANEVQVPRAVGAICVHRDHRATDKDDPEASPIKVSSHELPQHRFGAVLEVALCLDSVWIGLPCTMPMARGEDPLPLS